MSHTPHDLALDFPQYAQQIHDLREEDAHFARLLEQYNNINKQVGDAETNIRPMPQSEETALRKERMRLKDVLYHMLVAAAAEA
ncbi:MAG: YdcH family protein [Rhodobacteraceae bacterium]|nr:YdcH family protein [Alphaproteobacteria bacterium]MBT8474432.1 YdcH family protein [Alphaproteobacteria bacterium]NNF72390.1 YdcH family protein [Paracoccaceae bacterium]NNK67539.1 YdcH family protein [Paracoccaceae bacterium]